jgi:thiol:disulfide interchange protein
MRLSFLSVIKTEHSNTSAHAGHAPLMLIVALLWAALVSGTVHGQASVFGDSTPRFLDVDQAFSFYTSLDSQHQVSVHWTIAPEYYMYSDKFSARAITADGNSTDLALQLPAGVAHFDEFFGEVTVYYHQLRIILPIQDIQAPFTLEIDFQGCAEAGLCYPPTSRQTEIFR